MVTRSPLIWFGGKGKIAQHIISRMPDHTCYVEPFGGAAHVIAQKPPVYSEVYNDIDGEVVNFLTVAINEPVRLKQACDDLPYSRALYEQWKREKPPVDDFARAVRFFYINRSGIAKGNSDSVFSTETGWRHGKEYNTARTYRSACEVIPEFSKRMKSVMIDNRDFRDIIRVYDAPYTLFYIDPPYLGREKYYAGKFTEQDHRDLAEMLNKIRGKAIVSYYDDSLLHELYPNWNRETFRAARQVVNGSSNTATEILLMNFDNGQLTLF
ncbi:DNA adenine methylase [Paenibacillus woosongensis]|uniref:DNA methyltransferase n=1 Tax=Paenibacillus woosongensis TaxID=307580 RepID=A0ABQ4MYY7_9BACL|nr:DNA adenine methylase [Paenibacillus woosongensis]GIP61149.1 DNA methyltransferase [Paenibacillus woosongensis]